MWFLESMFHAILVTFCGREFISGWALSGFCEFPLKSRSLNTFQILLHEEPVPSEGTSPSTYSHHGPVSAPGTLFSGWSSRA